MEILQVIITSKHFCVRVLATATSLPPLLPQKNYQSKPPGRRFTGIDQPSDQAIEGQMCINQYGNFTFD